MAFVADKCRQYKERQIKTPSASRALASTWKILYSPPLFQPFADTLDPPHTRYLLTQVDSGIWYAFQDDRS
jgi:hypothetical protein